MTDRTGVRIVGWVGDAVRLWWNGRWGASRSGACGSTASRKTATGHGGSRPRPATATAPLSRGGSPANRTPWTGSNTSWPPRAAKAGGQSPSPATHNPDNQPCNRSRHALRPPDLPPSAWQRHADSPGRRATAHRVRRVRGQATRGLDHFCDTARRAGRRDRRSRPLVPVRPHCRVCATGEHGTRDRHPDAGRRPTQGTVPGRDHP